MSRSLLFVVLLCLVYPCAWCQDATPEARLEKLEKAMPGFKASIDQIQAKGQDVSYPMVTYTVLENFIGYAREDIEKGEPERGSMAISDLEKMAAKLDKELADVLSGKTSLPSVPRWTGDTRPIIKSSSFIAPTTTPGKPGREMRPVFFTGYGHFLQVRSDLEKFPNYGINIIQIEIGVMNVLPEDGKLVDPGADLVALLDRAQKAGVAVNLLLSQHYFPAWALDKYPELRKRREGFLQFCLHAPEGQALLKQFVSVVIPPIKDHPALHSICLSNEPWSVEEPCKYATAEWHEWLEKKHGDIATLNSRWGTDYTSFDAISLPNPLDADAKKPMSRWVDFVRWNQEFFAGWHKMLADAVHEVAPNLPVHAKVQGFTLINPNFMKVGNDPYLLAQVVDINGNDGGIVSTFGDGLFSQTWLSGVSFYDLQRSMKDAPIFNSENHLITDREIRYVPAEHIRASLWQQAIHGQSATTIWVWERTFDKKHDFAGSIMHRPACAEAVGIVNHDLNRAAKEITALQQVPVQALILNNTTGLTYGADTIRMLRMYAALISCGINVGFITERQLEEGQMPNTALVCVPAADQISNAAFSTLQKYKGHIIILGDKPFAYDEYGKDRPQKLAVDCIPFDDENTTIRELTEAVRSRLNSWNIRPQFELVEAEGKPLVGVEWRSAEVDGETVVNICNYLSTPVSVKLTSKGKDISAVDVLSGSPVSGIMELQPMEVRLVRITD